MIEMDYIYFNDRVPEGRQMMQLQEVTPLTAFSFDPGVFNDFLGIASKFLAKVP
jgi:hypothetical protein